MIAQELPLQYALRFGDNTDYRRRVWAHLVSYFSRWIPPESVVLDVGCGWGEFINAVHARQRIGMDLNPESARRLAPDVTFLRQDCSRAGRWRRRAWMWCSPPTSSSTCPTRKACAAHSRR